MVETIEKLGGYILITTGFYLLYLLIFRKSRLPKVFSKLWVILTTASIAIASIICGWFLVS